MAARKKQPAEAAAKVTFYTPDPDQDGAERKVEQGEKLPVDHPIVQGHRELFQEA